jgi:hypothetical protein
MPSTGASIKAIGMLARRRPMSGPQVDQNRLWGVLALRQDFVRSEGMIFAINVWAVEK